MFSRIYKLFKKADTKRQKANKMNNDAESLEMHACKEFNKIICVEHIQQLCAEVDSRGYAGEKEDIHNILNKKQYKDLDIEDVKKYKMLDTKYGEGLEYNKAWLERLFDNMGD